MSQVTAVSCWEWPGLNDTNKNRSSEDDADEPDDGDDYFNSPSPPIYLLVLGGCANMLSDSSGSVDHKDKE